MGGRLALTIRFSDDSEWRDAVWTNVVPEGLLAAEFFLDPVVSEKHTRQWLNRLEQSRKTEPELKKLWSNGGGLVPDEYGVLVIDYRNRDVVSAQGYTSVRSARHFVGEPKTPKIKKLQTAGLLTSNVEMSSARLLYFEIKSFWSVHETLGCTSSTMLTIQKTFSLSSEEKTRWKEYLKERSC